MATIKEEFESMKIRIAKGEGSKVIHIVDHEAEKKRRRNNPENSTKIYLNCYSPQGWRAIQTQKDRYFTLAVDPHIAIDLMARALAAFSDSVLRDWIEQGHSKPGEAPPDTPDWMR